MLKRVPVERLDRKLELFALASRSILRCAFAKKESRKIADTSKSGPMSETGQKRPRRPAPVPTNGRNTSNSDR